jgi:hypothetical protein
MNGDEIVADTSLLINFFLDFPLITMDSDFKKINQLNSLILESE